MYKTIQLQGKYKILIIVSLEEGLFGDVGIVPFLGDAIEVSVVLGIKVLDNLSFLVAFNYVMA